MIDWAAALDEYEARLAAFEAVLDGGRPAAGLWPPDDLVAGPIPPELADRARELLARSKEIENRLTVKQGELPTPRQPHRHRNRRRPAFSSFSTRM